MRSVSQEATLFEADETVVTDDDVVEKFDAQEFAALGEAQGDALVFRARSRVAGGVIVGDDDGGGGG